jgi:hypothetical protein
MREELAVMETPIAEGSDGAEQSADARDSDPPGTVGVIQPAP